MQKPGQPMGRVQEEREKRAAAERRRYASQGGILSIPELPLPYEKPEGTKRISVKPSDLPFGGDGDYEIVGFDMYQLAEEGPHTPDVRFKTTQLSGEILLDRAQAGTLDLVANGDGSHTRMNSLSHDMVYVGRMGDETIVVKTPMSTTLVEKLGDSAYGFHDKALKAYNAATK